MIAVDTSVMVAWFKGEPRTADAVEMMISALRRRQLVLPPIVVTELFAAPRLPTIQADTIRDIERLPLMEGYWERAGKLRAKVSQAGFKARLADAMVAQACIDTDVELIALDGDFVRFRPHGLKLSA